MSKTEKKKLGLIPKLLIAIGLGTLAGLFFQPSNIRSCKHKIHVQPKHQKNVIRKNGSMTTVG